MDRDEAADPLAEFHERQLNELKNLTVHRKLRAAAALHYCAEENICPPAWAVKEASQLLCDLLRREKAEKPGRTAGLIARYRQDLWDAEHWDAVEEVRRIRSKARRELDLMDARGDQFKGTSRRNNCERLNAWFSQYGTFECASLYLKGRDARIGADGLRASRRRCEERAAGSTSPDRYYLFDERFLAELGIPSLDDRKPGTKWLPLYDLQP